jgi:hypothetical protein
VNQFTRREAVGDLLSPDSNSVIFTCKAKLDSKGRILLPAEIRRNYALDKDSEISIAFDLKKNLILLVIGQGGVEAGIGACGAPGRGSIPRPDPGESIKDEGGEV